MYAVTNVTSAIVPASGTSRISAPIPTTAALGGDHRHAEEVLAHRDHHVGGDQARELDR
jgi:hypothetical protein